MHFTSHPLKLRWLFLAVLLPGAVALVMSVVMSYQRERASLDAHAMQATQALAYAVEREILGAQKALQGLAIAAKDIDGKDFSGFHRTAKRFLQETNIADVVVLTDRSGQMLVNTLVPPGEKLPRTVNMQRVREVFATERPYVSDLMRGVVSERMLISVDVPVIRDGRVVYDLSAALTVDRLNRLLEMQGLPSGYIAGIFDRNGIIVARTWEPEKYVGRTAVPALQKAPTGPPSGVQETETLEGVPVVVAYRRSETLGYSASVGIPVSVLVADLRRDVAMTGLAVTLVAMLGVWLAWRFGSQVLAVLRGLTNAVDAAAAGRSDFQLPREGPAELVRLARQFGQMMDARRKAEADVLAERQRLFNILETMPSYVVLLTSDYHAAFANRVFRERFGESHGRRCYEFLFHRSEPCEKCETFTVLGGPSSCEWEWTGPDGRTYLVYDRRIADADGNDCILEMGIDITERKRAEAEALRERGQREEAEAATRAKSAFLANMSHEIRTPMNAILGMAHLMRREGTTPKQAAQLDKIDTAASHLMHIINDVLDFSKIEAGKLILVDADVDIPALLANIVSILSPRTSGKRLRLTVEAEPLSGRLRGDPTRLTQALLNYANNAVKFTSQGTIAIRMRVLDNNAADVLLRFEVVDTGVGIPEEQLGRLFVAFEQADNSMTRQYGGTGLGLAITRRLAILMGGEAGATSVAGQGSTFWFTARLKKTSAAASEAEQPDEDAEKVLASDFNGRRLLLVEDDEINREIALELLADIGLVVDVAADGLEAVDCARNNRYDIVLMDMQMPRMDGVEATRRIRAEPRGAAVPIVAMTANVFSDDRQRCEEAGMNDFLPKPVLPQQLYATLLKWLRLSESMERD